MERYELQYTAEEIDRLLGSIDIKSITYGELKTLRDNAQLNAGQWYRITDYQCTTTQKDTQAANHQFDIIVTADAANKLNENARAINHQFAATTYEINEGDNEFVYPAECEERSIADAMSGFTPESGDRISEVVGSKYAIYHPVYGWGGNLSTLVSGTTYIYTSQSSEKKTLSFAPSDYFANCNLAAWQLKYCLDNDTNRFAWAEDEKEMPAQILQSDNTILYRYPTEDKDSYYAWRLENGSVYYTLSETPSVGDVIYGYRKKSGYYDTEYTILSYTPSYTVNGTGVIYRMIDEWGNDCPYDFKNILFSWDDDMYYTFSILSQSRIIDSSLDSSHFVCSNVIKECHPNDVFLLQLGYCIFSGHNVFNNIIGEDSLDIHIGENCNCITVGRRCSDVTVNDNVRYMTLSDAVTNLTINGASASSFIQYISVYSGDYGNFSVDFDPDANYPTCLGLNDKGAVATWSPVPDR